MKSPAGPTPRPVDADVPAALADVLPADPLERSLTVEFMHLNNSTHPDAGAARDSILQVIAGIAEGRRSDAEAVEMARAHEAGALKADTDGPAHNVFAAMVVGSTTSAAQPRKRMGRPPTNGIKPAGQILRTLEVLKHFEEARRTLGHTAAITATVKAIKAGNEAWPGMTAPKPVAWEKAGLKWNSPPAEVQRVSASTTRVEGISASEVKSVLALCQTGGRTLAFRVRPHGNGGALFVGTRPVKRIKLNRT